MKQTSPLIRLLSIVLVLSLLSFGLVPIQADAVKVSCAEYDGSNQLSSYHSRWGSTVKSHLVNVDGGLMRFQSNAVADGYLVEYYDSSYNLLQTVTVSTELPIYGGFYASSSNYYILSGQTNSEESADVECFRITKYDLNWNRLGSVGLYDCNTTVPFDAGSARFAMSGKYLVIRTAHEMYTSDDGYNHQANVTIEVDTETMTVTDSFCTVMNSSFGYVSHSFNQFVHVENNKIIAVDHGDAYPRSIALIQYNTDMSTGVFTPTHSTYCTVTNLFSFPGTTGDNSTGASVGGFEISSSSYLVAYNYVVNADNYASNSATRNVFIASMDKTSGEVTLKQITSYADGDTTASVPHLVKLSDISFLVLWEQGDTVYYTMLDAAGDPVGEIYSMENAALSDCVPIVSGSKAVWYVWNDNLVNVYEIDLNDLSATNSIDLQFGHRMEITTYPTAAGGDCTLTCKDCGYTETGSTPTQLTLWWSDATTGGYYYYSPPHNTYDVGEQLYLLNETVYDGADFDQCTVTVSDPSGVEMTWVHSRKCQFTFTKPGSYKITVTCDYNPLLTRSVTITVAHTYEDGVCTGCGAVEVVPTVKMSSVSLALKDEVKFTGYFTIENIDASTATMGLMTFENAPTDVSVDTADHVIPGATYQSSKDRYIGYSQGIPAKEMGDLFCICAYVQLENGTYVYSDVVEYSVEKYAYAMLDYTNDADLQKLLIAMLNYGAEAQLYFGYNTDDLVNADLTDEQKNSLNSYSSDLMDAIVTADSSKTGNFVYTEAAFSTKTVNVTAGGALALSYRFNPAYTMDGDMTMYYWDATTYNSVDELTVENATGSATMTVVNGAYQPSVTGIAAKDIDKTIYAVGVYESDGVTYTTGVISYNLNTYFDILPQVRPACQGVCEAAVVYCDYAKLYFLGE